MSIDEEVGLPPHDTVPNTPAPGEPFEPELQRAAGAVIGAAVGDTLGAPGHLTDGMQMGLVLAECLLEHGRFPADAVGARWQTWGSAVDGDGGVLARSFPLAVAFFEATDAAVLDVCLRQAALTHADPAAGWGAWIGVELMRFAIAGDDLWPELERLVDDVPDDVRTPFADVLHPTWSPVGLGSSFDTVWGCLAPAVWALRSTTSFEDAVVAAQALSGASPSVVTLAGAVAGATYGVDAIPAAWRAEARCSVLAPSGVDRYDAARLADTAQRLFSLALH